MSRLRLPEEGSRAWVLAAALVWAGVSAGRGSAPAAAGAVAVLAVLAVVRRRLLVVMIAATVAGLVSGLALTAREAALVTAAVPEGPADLVGRVEIDPIPWGEEWRLRLRPEARRSGGRWSAWDGPMLLVRTPERPDVSAGDRIEVTGALEEQVNRFRGSLTAGTLRARRLIRVAGPGDPLFRVGNALRRRVTDTFDLSSGAAGALMRGFLIGDTTGLPSVDGDALRRAGLSHYVAVSGSNVALFLTLLWVVAAPLAGHPVARGALGLAGLAVFVVVTRWEPSVVRAAIMAGLVLVARAAGISLGPWEALSAAVAGALLLSAGLAEQVGFQLSVAATGGVIAGARLFSGVLPRLLASPLGATVGAQLAVTPLLLATFGRVPLLSPLTNLVAAPLVAASTTAGVAAVVTGSRAVAVLVLAPARLVLAVARLSAGWPQLGPAAVLVGSAVVGATLVRRLRVVALATAATLAVAGLAPGVGRPARPAVVFLDVGEGDSILLLGTSSTVLVDGGPDPVLLSAKLRQYGVRVVDLLVVSHPHADHMAGLEAVVGRLSVLRLWERTAPHTGEMWEAISDLAEEAGIPRERPLPGRRMSWGDLSVTVLGPQRRYETANDQSLVLLVEIDGMRVLLPGDLEAVAQRELGPVAVDVLKVPHQGAATSDLDWLRGSAGRLAVICVGANTYGHPASTVIEALQEAGAEVARTDRLGDVVVQAVNGREEPATSAARAPPASWRPRGG